MKKTGLIGLMGLFACWMCTAAGRPALIRHNAAPENSEILAVYGSGLDLVRLTADQLDRLNGSDALVRDLSGYRRIGLGALTVIPGTAGEILPEELTYSETDSSDVYIIQFAGPLHPDWRHELTALGVSLRECLGRTSYLARLADPNIGLDRLPYIDGIARFHPVYKLAGNLKDRYGWTRYLEVLIFDDGRLEETIARIEQLGLTYHDRFRVRFTEGLIYHYVLFEGPVEAAPEISKQAEVRYVEFASDRAEPDDEMTDQIIVGNYTAGVPFPGYMDWINTTGYTGAGTRVSDVDTGFDTNNNATCHLDVRGRLVEFINYGSSSDTNGHGTHTGGIILGNGDSGVMDPQGFLYGLGVAPEALLVVQNSIASGVEFPPPGGYQVIHRDTVRADAHISSNSWWDLGGTGIGYTANSALWDAAVRDADDEATGLEPLTLVYSAGNSGPGSSTITSPKEAKNLIVTGGTRNYRVGNINDMYSSSSRGPALDGRYLPNVVAPAEGVYSCVPGGGHDDKTGTSMACPHSTGTVALIQHWWSDQYPDENPPAPAMNKALLINSAVDIGVGTIPNNDQGWGRINPDNLLNTPYDRVLVNQEIVFTATGDSWETPALVTADNEPLKVTLVWTDPPASAGANPALLNDLDLIVEQGTTVYRGNNFSSGWSVPGGTADSLNNIECIYVENASGLYTVRVEAIILAADAIWGSGGDTDQDFALVITNAIDQSSDGIITLDRNRYSAGIPMVIRVSDLDLHGQGTQDVSVESDSEPGGETVMLTETGSDTGIFEGSIYTTGTPGVSGELTIAHGDEIRAIYHDEDNGSGVPEDKMVTAEADMAGPVISGVAVTALSATAATIEWVTDEPATSLVRYGETTPPGSTVDAVGYRTTHIVDLTGLEPCTLYYFEVESDDEAGNRTTDDNGGVYYFFLTYEQVILIDEPLDIDPGWTISGGQWAFGQPTGGGGSYGEPDPTAGYTGSNVYGYNLNGDYSSNIPAYYLTPPAFDCSEGVEVTLTYYRWLGVERNVYDHAVLQISNDGGSTWHNVWENGSTSISGGSWEAVEHDISQWADGYSDVRLRWQMGTTDGSVVYCGWNIDDILVQYETECTLPTPTLPPTHTPQPTSTTVPPTDTPIPPTDTPPPPTNTMIPTNTHIPTNTPIPPTDTPVPPSNTPNPTDTPAPPTGTPVPPTVTVPPTATPECDILGVTLWMPSEYFTPGDPCACRVFVCNPDPDGYANMPLFVILDVYGLYFFAPSFSDFDYYSLALVPGEMEIEVLPEFTWPEGAGSASGILWYGAMTDPGITQLFGEMDTWEFGWGV
ncbi:S8 family serine peptidase [bacterium]|nr:S8 family serine peptidase [candidate division CSSED10-310 bacterium]